MISNRQMNCPVFLKADKERLAGAAGPRLETKTAQLVPDFLCNRNYTKNLLMNVRCLYDVYDFVLLNCCWFVEGRYFQ